MLCVARSPGLCLFREAAEVNAILGPRAVRYRAAVVNNITRVRRRLKEGVIDPSDCAIFAEFVYTVSIANCDSTGYETGLRSARPRCA